MRKRSTPGFIVLLILLFATPLFAQQRGLTREDFAPFKANKEEFMQRRFEGAALKRGVEIGKPFDPMKRLMAIQQMQAQKAAMQAQRGAGISPSGNFVFNNTWTEIGPNPIPNGQVQSGSQLPVSGRTISIAIHPTNPNIVYVGTAQGGLYRTTNGGATWVPLMDNAASLAIGTIAISPSSPETIYVGTGESSFSADSYFGVGIYRIDNASSGSPVVVGPIGGSVFTGRAVSKIVVHPTNPDIIFVGSASGIGGIGGVANNVLANRGLFRSTNATTASPTFTQLTITGIAAQNRNVVDMIMDPGNPDLLLLTIGDSFNLGEGGVYRTTNATAPVPSITRTFTAGIGTTASRTELALHRSGGGTITVYAASGFNGGTLQQSVDGGATWTQTIDNNFCTPQCFYDIAVAVDPTDATRVYLGGSPTLIFGISTNSGASFTPSLSGLHVDSHVIEVAPSDPTVIYFGSDGGIYKSTNSGTSWSSLNNTTFRATQFMGLAVHPTDPNFTIGGTQDNGTNMYKPDATWNRIDFGDGGYAVIDQNAADVTNVTMYHTYFNQTNAMGYGKVTTVAGAVEALWPFYGCGFGGSIPNGMTCAASACLFYAPMENGPGNPNTLYFGSDVLYRSANEGVTMTKVSQEPIQSGVPISAIGISPQNDNVRLVGLSNGALWGTTSGSSTLTNMDPSGNVPNNYIARAVIDPTNVNTAYVTLSAFGVVNIWKTTNLNAATPTWTSISTGIPLIPVNGFVVDPANTNNLYAGTDIGVYASDNGGTSWSPLGTGLPAVAVFDMAISPGYKLRIATHGRGMWDYPLTLAGPIPLIISEFRLRGPSGANDEFIEIYNTSNVPYTVASVSGTGLGVAASDGVTRFSIPNGTVIPPHGHYLGTNSVAYSLSGYATADATFVTDIPDNAGIALFDNNVGGASYVLANRLDAVGSTSEANVLYKEGTGYPALTPFSIDYTFHRHTRNGPPIDTDNNATDFQFGDTNGTSAGAGQRLGAPGPENLASPVARDANVVVTRLDQTVGALLPPNMVRDFTSDPANNSTFGTIDLRYRVTNNTGVPLTRLRFRIDSVETFPAPFGIADLRVRTSSAIVVSGINDPATCGIAPTPCTVTIQGTTLEQPPSQPNGGGFNSSMSAGTVTLGTPLPSGASINIRLFFGIQQTGNFVIRFTPEILPATAVTGSVPTPEEIIGSTDAPVCILTCPSNITVSNDPGQCGAIVNYPPVTGSGTCGTITSTPGSGTFFPIGTTTVNASSSTGGGSCSFTVTVNDTQAPVLGACPSNITLCGGPQAVTFTLPGMTDNCPGGSVVAVPASGSVFPNGTTTVTVTATDASSNTASCSFTVTINPTPDAVATPSSQQVCSGATITTIVLTSAVSGTTYNWTRDNTVAVTGIAASGSGDISGALTNTTIAPVTVTFTITPTANGCPGTAISATVTVNPIPTVNPTADQLVCNGTSTAAITFTGPVPGTTFNWTNSDPSIGLAASGTGNIASFTAANGTNVPVVATVTVTPSITSNSAPVTFSNNTAVIIPAVGTSGPANPYPSGITVSGVTGNLTKVTVTLKNMNHSFPDDIDILLVGPGGQRLILMSDAGGSADLVNNTYTFDDAAASTLADGALNASGTYRPSNFGTGDTYPAPAPVGPYPDPQLLSVFNGISPNGTWSLYVQDDVGGDIGNINSGWDLTLTTGVVCTGTPDDFTITVNPTPNATATPSSQEICSGATITTIALTGSVSGTTYSWTRNNTGTVTGIAASGTGDISGTLTNTTTAPVTVTFTITPSANGCNGTSITATVLVNPSPTVDPVADQVVCNGASTTAITFTGPVSGTAFNWTNNTPSIGLAASGSGNIASFTATNAGTAPVVATITVTPMTGSTTTFANTTPIIIPAVGTSGPATPYPSNIAVSGVTGNVTNITVKLNSYNQTFPDDVDVLLVGPGGQNAIIMSDVGGSADAINLTITLDDAAASALSDGGPLTSGTFQPTNVGAGDAFAAPAPVPSGGSALSVFNGTAPNGTWSLYVVDDVGGDIGNFNGGWELTISTGVICTGPPEVFTITVNPTPNAIATPSSQTRCSGVAIQTIVLSSSVSGTTYAWTRDNVAAVTGIAANGTGNISGTLTNTTTSPVTVTFTITPTANGCPGTPITATVLVNPTPDAIATPSSQTICSGSAITAIALTSNIAGTTFTWTRNNTVTVTGMPASGSGTPISGTLTNNTNAPITVTFTITPTANGCAGPTTTATVTVNPIPTVTPQGQMQVIITGNGFFADEITWTLTNAAGTVVLSGGPYGFNPPATPSALVTSAGGPFTFFIEAQGTFNDNAALWEVRCGGAIVVSGCIRGTGSFATCGNVGTLTVPNINGCGSNLGPQTVCSGTPITPVVLVGPVAGTVFNWTRDNTVNVTGIPATGSGNISGTLTNTTNVPQTVIFTITPTANGCPGPSVTVTFTVNPTPNAVATPGSQTICSSTAITPIVMSGNVAGTTYAWTRNNTANITGIPASGSGNISGTLTNTTTTLQTTTFTIIPTANGCAGPATTATVSVQAPLTIVCPANITVNAAPGTCFATVSYAATVTGTPAPTVTYVPASGSSFPIGTTTVTVTATNICGTVSCTFTVTVLDVQIPVITPLTNQTVCVGSSATFTAVSTFASSYQWQSWNGSAWVNITGATGASHTINNVTYAMNTNSFRVRVTGPCGTVTTSNHAILYVNTLPTITITSNIQPQLLPGQFITLTATGTPAGGSFVWRKNGVVIAGATSSTLGPLNVLDVGTYMVTYTDPNGCVSSSANFVISAQVSEGLYIYPNPNTGQFHVRFYNVANEQATITVYNYLGAIVYQKKHMTGPLQYSIIDVDLGKRLAIGTYVVDVRNAQNLRIGAKLISVGRQ